MTPSVEKSSPDASTPDESTPDESTSDGSQSQGKATSADAASSIGVDPSFAVSSRYEFLRVVGDGLMGVVFEMLDRQTQGSVAARLITHAVPRNPKKFARALDSLSRIEHPHLVRFIEHIERDELHYVVSQFADGVDLLTYLRQPPTPEELVALAKREDIADAGITDTHEAAHTGPIEVAVDYDASQDEEGAGADAPEPGEDMDAEANIAAAKSDASEEAVKPVESSAAPESELGPADSANADDGVTQPDESMPDTDEATLEWSDPASEDAPGAESDELAGFEEESVADIVESVADPSPMNRQDALDLVLLRLERILPQIVDALEYLHRFKKHHGDLKPGNILVDHTGRCLLTDFGLVQELKMLRDGESVVKTSAEEASAEEASIEEVPKEQDDETSAETEETPRSRVEFGPPAESALADSFAYRAPENLDFEESEEAGPAADLYALGCVLYEAISGRRVFDGKAREIRDRQRHAEPRPLSEVEPYCPASWADVIHGLLAKDPRRRSSLGEVRELVEYSESYAIDIPASAVPEQDLFFGRSEVLDLILDKVKACYQQKRLSVSILRGTSGVGKTAISQAVSYLVSRRGWLVLSGKCYNRESLIYQGWDEIAAQLARIFEELPSDVRQKVDLCRRQAATLFPALRLPDDPPPRQMARLDAIDSFRSLLRRIASQRPLLLLIDDLHWASWDTTSLLLDVIGEPNGLRCMVLGTWLGEGETDDPRKKRHPLISGLASAPTAVSWVDLGGFSKDEAREYVISAGAHLSLPDQQRVLRGGESNPLLLEELIFETRESSLAERREAMRRGDAQPVPADAALNVDKTEVIGETRNAPQSDAAPRTGKKNEISADKLTAVVAERIETLSRRDRFVLELLSVASIPLPSAIISTILDDEFDAAAPGENNARDALDRLLECRFIEPVKSHHWEIAYSVAHNSYRKLILDQLRDQRYAHLCKCIAEGIRRCWPSAEELRFEYLLRAGLDRDAADSAIRAASSAEQRFAYNRAAKLWRWLSEHAGFTSVSPDTNPVAEHARLERLAHRYERAHELFHEVAEETPPGLQRAGFLRDEFEACVRSAHHQQAISALEQALGVFDESYGRRGFLSQFDEVKSRARAAASRWTDDLGQAEVDVAGGEDRLRAELYCMVLDLEDLLDSAHVDRMRTRLSLLAEQTNDARLLGLDRLYRARHASMSGGARRHRRIAGWLQQAAALFARADDPQLRGICEIVLADQLRLRGQFDEAENHLAAAAKFFRNTRLPELRQRYRLRLSYARLLGERGALADANFAARQVLHFWRGDRYVMLRAYQVLIPNALAAGHTQHAEELLEQCRPLLRDLPTNLSEVWLGRMDARLNIAMGRAEVAVGHLDVLAEKMHACGLIKNHYAAALLYLSLGQSLAALAERERSLIQNRRTDTLDRLKAAVGALESERRVLPPALRAEAARLSSRLELLRGNPKKGLRILDAAIQKLVGYPNPIQWAKCLEARGRLLRALEVSEAPALIDQAMSTYARFDAHLPLFLEGWPVPSKFSQLAGDE
jgi:serine/threonine protein kinase